MLQEQEAFDGAPCRNTAAPWRWWYAFIRRSVWIRLCVGILSVLPHLSFSQQVERPAIDRTILHFQTKRLDISTDLDRPTAQLTAHKLEQSLDTLTHYWHRPVRQRIHVFLVDELDAWSPAMFPNERAYKVLRHLGGASEATAATDTLPPQVAVYARNQTGIPEHEIVHAYCIATFGWCGPEWFAEGMAERAYHGWHRSAVLCKNDRILSLRKSTPTLDSIIQLGSQRAAAAEQWIETENERCANESSPGPFEPKSIDHLRRNYDTCWALCHFLGHHPKYRKGFQRYGCHCLRGEPCNLTDFLGDTTVTQLESDFHKFLGELANGSDPGGKPPQHAVHTDPPTAHENKVRGAEHGDALPIPPNSPY